MAHVAAPAATTTIDRQVVNAVYAGEGDYEARLLRAKLDANPLDLEARLELARHYQHSGFPEIAIEHCRLACERAPESAAAHLALAKMLRETGHSGEAAEALEGFTARHTGNADVFAWLGLLQDEAGSAGKAETAHRKAVELAPGRDDLHNNLGVCLLHQGRREEAAAEFRAALKINAQSVVARNNLGEAVSATDSKAAVLNWQSVTDPASAHSNMAAVLIEAGKYGDARKEIGRALDYNPNNPAALRNLHLVSQRDGKAAEIRLPAKSSAQSLSRLARARAAWHHYWFSESKDSEKERQEFVKDSAEPVASR